MSAKKRIYVVTNSRANPSRQSLIRATSSAQALRHAARDAFDVSVASQDALVLLLEAGIKVEEAGEEVSEDQASGEEE